MRKGVDYGKFIESHIRNTDNVLISQSVCNNQFRGLFVNHKIYSGSATMWGNSSPVDDFREFVEQFWNNGFNIYSLAVDDHFGFGVFCVSGYGSGQLILQDSSSELISLSQGIRDAWKNDYMITAVGAKDSTFYVVMMWGVEELEGKYQMWFTRSSWNETEVEMD